MIEQELECDHQYVITLLKLCLNYPEELLNPSKQLYLLETTNVKVFNDATDEDKREPLISSKCKGELKFHTVKVPTHILSDVKVKYILEDEQTEGNTYWSSHVYLLFLGYLRSSFRFM